MSKRILTILMTFILTLTVILTFSPFSLVASYNVELVFEREGIRIIPPENRTISEKIYPGQILRFNETIISIKNNGPRAILLFMDFNVTRNGIASTLGSYKFEVTGRNYTSIIDPGEDLIILIIYPNGFANISFIYSIRIPHNYSAGKYWGSFIVTLESLRKVPIIIPIILYNSFPSELIS